MACTGRQTKNDSRFVGRVKARTRFRTRDRLQPSMGPTSSCEVTTQRARTSQKSPVKKRIHTEDNSGDKNKRNIVERRCGYYPRNDADSASPISKAMSQSLGNVIKNEKGYLHALVKRVHGNSWSSCVVEPRLNPNYKL